MYRNEKRYEVKVGGDVNIVVWDSPGLQDGSGKEEEYLAELKKSAVTSMSSFTASTFRPLVPNSRVKTRNK